MRAVSRTRAVLSGARTSSAELGSKHSKPQLRHYSARQSARGNLNLGYIGEAGRVKPPRKLHFGECDKPRSLSRTVAGCRGMSIHTRGDRVECVYLDRDSAISRLNDPTPVTCRSLATKILEFHWLKIGLLPLLHCQFFSFCLWLKNSDFIIIVLSRGDL